jgi:undecaprenyl-diphosphatase
MKRFLSGERMLAGVELRFLVLLAGLAASVWGFLSIGGEMTEGDTLAFDHRLLLGLRVHGDPAEPIGPRAFEEAMRDITALGGFTVLTLVTIVSVVAFAMHRRWKHAGVMAGTILLAQFCSRFLKNLYDRPRPDLAPHLVEVYSASFPSGHSMLSAATYLTLAALIAHLEVTRRARVMVFVLALLLIFAIGFSRVYMGVHWPSDVMAGWCAGAAWALVAWLVLIRLEARAPPLGR